MRANVPKSIDFAIYISDSYFGLVFLENHLHHLARRNFAQSRQPRKTVFVNYHVYLSSAFLYKSWHIVVEVMV